jgi:hypothetical protein
MDRRSKFFGFGKHLVNYLLNVSSQPLSYDQMLREQETMPLTINSLVGFFTWLLLAGYVVLPGTFTTLNRVKNVVSNRSTETFILQSVQNIPLLWLAALCCIIGSSGICFIWWICRNNFVWLINHLFLYDYPSLMPIVLIFLTVPA